MPFLENDNKSIALNIINEVIENHIEYEIYRSGKAYKRIEDLLNLKDKKIERLKKVIFHIWDKNADENWEAVCGWCKECDTAYHKSNKYCTEKIIKFIEQEKLNE